MRSGREFLRERCCRVSGYECKGYVSVGKDFRDGKRVAVAETDIEQCTGELGIFGQTTPLFDRACRPHNFAIVILKNQLRERRNEPVVFDH